MVARHRTVDWDFFLPRTRESRVAQVGAGFGERTLALSRMVAAVVAFVPSESNALVVNRCAAESGATNVQVAVLERTDRLPLDGGSVDAVAMDHAGAESFGLARGSIAPAIAEFRRVLVSGGTLFMGVENRLRRRILPGPPRDAAERKSRHSGPGIRKVIRELERNGFRTPTLLAPLPGREQIEIVLPVRQRAVMNYFFDNMLRKNSRLMRAALAGARAATAFGLLRWTVPDYFVYADLGEPTD